MILHGTRSLVLTGLVSITAIATIALAPSAGLPWSWIACAYAGAALSFHLIGRVIATNSGIIPFGTVGDSRFTLAAAATLIAIMSRAEPALAQLPFTLLVLAAVLCGMADGAWLAAAMRHLKLSFFQVLRIYLRELCRKDDITWRIVTGGRS